MIILLMVTAKYLCVIEDTVFNLTCYLSVAIYYANKTTNRVSRQRI